MKYKAGPRGLRHKDIYGGTRIWNAGKEVAGAAGFKDLDLLIKKGKLVKLANTEPEKKPGRPGRPAKDDAKTDKK